MLLHVKSSYPQSHKLNRQDTLISSNAINEILGIKRISKEHGEYYIIVLIQNDDKTFESHPTDELARERLAYFISGCGTDNKADAIRIAQDFTFHIKDETKESDCDHASAKEAIEGLAKILSMAR